ADEGTGEESGGSGAAELERLRAACGEAVTAIPDATAVPALPTDWPDAPPGAVLCTVTSSGASGTLQFVTDSAAAAVLDYYEPLLSASAPHRGDGVGGFPILNGTAGETEWAIQTGDGFYFVAVEQ
ncbi:hypothetical protein, partial [Microbacterium sp.]|uniref:hypothetical protein n=1 Tax=Microbacterium sp. TaxID=51671 RepID=UPI003C711A3C